MTRVSELEQAWRQIAGMLDREDVPWQRVADLTEESLDLGENLLRVWSEVEGVAAQAQAAGASLTSSPASSRNTATR